MLTDQAKADVGGGHAGRLTGLIRGIIPALLQRVVYRPELDAGDYGEGGVTPVRGPIPPKLFHDTAPVMMR